jgi:hypothetical protein
LSSPHPALESTETAAMTTMTTPRRMAARV